LLVVGGRGRAETQRTPWSDRIAIHSEPESEGNRCGGSNHESGPCESVGAESPKVRQRTGRERCLGETTEGNTLSEFQERQEGDEFIACDELVSVPSACRALRIGGEGACGEEVGLSCADQTSHRSDGCPQRSRWQRRRPEWAVTKANRVTI